MPRFHLNTHSGDDVTFDIEGEELPDLSAARAAAMKDALDVIIKAAKSKRRPPDCIQVTDGECREIFTDGLHGGALHALAYATRILWEAEQPIGPRLCAFQAERLETILVAAFCKARKL